MILSDALANATGLITTNGPAILSYFVAVIGALFVIVLGKKALFWVFNQIKGLFN